MFCTELKKCTDLTLYSYVFRRNKVHQQKQLDIPIGMNDARSGKHYLNTTFFAPFQSLPKLVRIKHLFKHCHRLQRKSNSREGYILSYHVRLEYIKRKKFTRSCKFGWGGEFGVLYMCVCVFLFFALLKAEFRNSPKPQQIEDARWRKKCVKYFISFKH